MYASDFDGIPAAVAANIALLERIRQLVASEPIPGKITEGVGREDALRGVLSRLFLGEITVREAFTEVRQALPRSTSLHAGDNRVFANGWEERLVRTQVSRFYNQAVLETLVAQGASDCFVDHSSFEQATSECSLNLAGKRHTPQTLLDRLVRSYRDGIWTKDLKIPHHPHCTHTVQP